MERIDSVIAELETARHEAVEQFAHEVNMPVSEFLRHFRVILEGTSGTGNEVSFRVEPRE
jgi:hypothetical protein